MTETTWCCVKCGSYGYDSLPSGCSDCRASGTFAEIPMWFAQQMVAYDKIRSKSGYGFAAAKIKEAITAPVTDAERYGKLRELIHLLTEMAKRF